jgi:hypothetical protein
MPFDATPFTTIDQVADPTALYRERREKAAALWERVPVEVFNMSTWICGTTACALGHLGSAGFDGWVMDGDADRACPVWNDKVGQKAGASYFGLPADDAEALFCCGNFERAYPHRDYLHQITPTDVARTLLALPYTLPSEVV